jgi:UDP-N-acetylmuramoyl-tripeptide--D-alanyl-D-alanine ligase
MNSALAVMDSIAAPGRRVLILGDMRELGEAATRCHQALGQDAGRSTAQLIIAIGAYARVVADGATSRAGTTKRIYSYPSVEAAADKIPELLEPGDIVLLKASRAVKLERLVPYMEKTAVAPASCR